MNPKRFTGTVDQTGSRAVIVLPFDPNEIWGVRERHHITGSINGCKFRGPIESDDERFFLSLGAAWRRDNGVAAGDKVRVELSPEGPQSGALAPDIASAFEQEPRASAFFDSLPTFYRKNYMRWIDSAKRPETRNARIAEMIRLLADGRRER